MQIERLGCTWWRGVKGVFFLKGLPRHWSFTRLRNTVHCCPLSTGQNINNKETIALTVTALTESKIEIAFQCRFHTLVNSAWTWCQLNVQHSFPKFLFVWGCNGESASVYVNEKRISKGRSSRAGKMDSHFVFAIYYLFRFYFILK